MLVSNCANLRSRGKNMTIEAKIKSLLVNHGLFENMAEKVIEAVKEAPENEAMQGRWGEDESAYPPAITALGWLSAKRHAVAIIDKECPKHWARPIFAGRT